MKSRVHLSLERAVITFGDSLLVEAQSTACMTNMCIAGCVCVRRRWFECMTRSGNMCVHFKCDLGDSNMSSKTTLPYISECAADFLFV